MKAQYVLPCLLLLSISITAQTYDIGQYRARFERRPFLELNPRLNYSGTFTNTDISQDNHQGGASVAGLWREQSNLDHRIRSWSASGNTGFSRQEFENDGLPDRSNFSLLLQGSLEQYNYKDNNNFWGFRASASLSTFNRQENDLLADRQTQLGLNPGIFLGTGRIEFAEDALLANWMMDDLLEAGVIASATAEERLALAQRITSIIGNRTFDFRRRRIYELQQLDLFFQESDIAIQNDFLLFAVLNDNWAFANRATLPHGQRWQFGVDAGGNYRYASLPLANDDFLLLGRPYVNYQHAQIRHNNAASIWEAELSGFVQDGLDDTNNLSPFFSFRSNAGANLSLSHSYVWLPISRTTLRWRNGASILFEHFRSNNPFFRDDLLNVQAESTLEWDYFISYNLRLSLNTGLQYMLTRNDSFRSRALRPFLNAQMNYAIF